MAQVIEISDSSFENEVLNSNIPTLVDFWAPWCGPCRAVAPILEEVSDEFQGRLKVCKINVDDNAGTAGQYGIRAIPSLALFKNGKLSEMKVGALAKSQMLAFINAHL